MDFTLDAARTAIVVIDLQRGIVGNNPTPHSGADVVTRAASLCRAFRAAGGTVVLVHVTPSLDGKDALMMLSDTPPVTPAERPADWAELMPELEPQPTASSLRNGSGGPWLRY